MNILDRILADKRSEVALRKGIVPLPQLESSELFLRPVNSLRASVAAHPEGGVIAEFKRRSPSKGMINDRASVREVVMGYARAGAAAISVLTDGPYFGGSADDLREARAAVDIPILRKDFIVDEYQLFEARAMGADAVLLIAAALDRETCSALADRAADLGLETLLELHGEEELDYYQENVSLVGINNRDLKTFTVDLERSVRMASLLPAGVLKVAESGLSDTERVRYLRDRGFGGFLIGEHFMKSERPGRACRDFIGQLRENP